MNETISKAVLSGIGFASLARDAIRDTAENLIKQSTLTQKEGERVVAEFQRRLVKTQKAVEKKVNAEVRKALKQLDLKTAAPAKNTATRPGKGRKKTKRAAARDR